MSTRAAGVQLASLQTFRGGRIYEIVKPQLHICSKEWKTGDLKNGVSTAVSTLVLRPLMESAKRRILSNFRSYSMTLLGRHFNELKLVIVYKMSVMYGVYIWLLIRYLNNIHLILARVNFSCSKLESLSAFGRWVQYKLVFSIYTSDSPSYWI